MQSADKTVGEMVAELVELEERRESGEDEAPDTVRWVRPASE